MSEVCVFGEFSPLDPWNVHVPCIYDPYNKCFKADIMIRTGQQFKFVVYGKHVESAYFISERYPFCIDDDGNINNVFIPKQIIRGAPRRIFEEEASVTIRQPTLESYLSSIKPQNNSKGPKSRDVTRNFGKVASIDTQQSLFSSVKLALNTNSNSLEKDNKLTDMMQMLVITQQEDGENDTSEQLDSKTLKAFDADIEPNNNKKKEEKSEGSNYRPLLLR